MEGGFTMLFHALIIAVIAYITMFFLLKQSRRVAEDRSVLLGAVLLVYMVLFGHGLPTSLNKNIA
jgi:hypothetical protein|uniref:Uncharacterized protein n=1 Tax=viral metagenome TaxID=1070528 RepID=A0A6C0IM69_9ZZZZ